MSLIADALKTAQREKQQRASGDRALSVPVLVPLRPHAEQGFSWRRTAVVAGAGAVVLVAVLVFARRGGRTAIRPVAATTPVVDSSELSPIAPPSALPRRPSVASAPTGSGRAARGDTTPARATRTASAPSTAAATQRTTVASPPLRIPPAGTDAVAREAAANREAPPPGRLSISVDRPRDAEVARLFAVGVAAHRNGDLAAARSAYESVLDLAPNDVDALNNLALVLLAQGSADRAEVALRRALSLAPKNGGAWSNLGAVLKARGRNSDAIAAFQHALDIDPDNEGARVSLAQEYFAIGSLDQARMMLADVVSSNPDNAEAQYSLGQVLERQGDVAGAARAYREFMRAAPQRLAAIVERVRQHLDTIAPATP